MKVTSRGYVAELLRIVSTTAPTITAARRDAPGRSRLAGLDGLRGLACVAVVATHVWLDTRTRRPDEYTTTDNLFHEGRLGLVAFFVLSGFLMWKPWAEGRAPSLPAFALGRVARIFPAYFAACAFVLLVLAPVADTAWVTLPPDDQAWRFLFLLQSTHEETARTLINPSWSLSVEAQFYVFIPIIGLTATRSRWLAPVAMIALGIWWNWRIGPHPEATLIQSLPAMAQYFGVGMLVAAACCKRCQTPFAALVAVVGLLALNWWLRVELDWAQEHVVRDLPAAAACGILVAVIAAGRGPRLLDWRPVVFLGTISYGVFLWHMPVMQSLRALGLMPRYDLAEGLLWVLPPTLLVATASWYLLERPVIERARQAVVSARVGKPSRAPS